MFDILIQRWVNFDHFSRRLGIPKYLEINSSSKNHPIGFNTNYVIPFVNLFVYKLSRSEQTQNEA